jgi:ABC-type transporter Mla subunit MlaD
MHLRSRYLVPLVCLLIASCHGTQQRIILVELERADGLIKGSDLIYRGVPAGHVESITFAEPHKLPVAKVVLASDSPPFTSTDEFRVASSGLLGDKFIEVTPRANPGVPLPNGALVRAQNTQLPLIDSIDELLKTHTTQLLSQVNFLKDIIDLPEPKRTEVLVKIRKLVDDAKKESTNK